MCIPDEICGQPAAKSAVLFPHLDERQDDCPCLPRPGCWGHGGVRTVARTAAVSETTVRKGVFELEAGEEPLGRVRRPGGGAKAGRGSKACCRTVRKITLRLVHKINMHCRLTGNRTKVSHRRVGSWRETSAEPVLQQALGRAFPLGSGAQLIGHACPMSTPAAFATCHRVRR